MKRLPFVAGGLVLCAAAAWILFRPPGARTQDTSLAAAWQRSKAWYLNETNQDYRRARKELLPFESRLGGSPAFLIDLALIDLAELNAEVQDQYRLVPEAPRHRELLESAQRRLERARALDPGNETVSYNLARTYVKLAPGAEDPDRLWHAAKDLLLPLLRSGKADPAALLLYGLCLEQESDDAAAAENYGRIVAMGEQFVPETLFRVACFKEAQSLLRVPARREDGTRRLDELKRRYPEMPRPAPGALERGRYTTFLELVDVPPAPPDPRLMNWRLVTSRAGIPACGRPAFFLAPDLDGDCARDLLLNGEGGLLALRNLRNASFEDLTASSGLPGDFPLAGAAAGDVDNDGDSDLLVVGPRGARVYVNETPPDERRKWKFLLAADEKGSNALGARAGEEGTCAVLLDLDHDGDLDLFVGGARNRVYRTVIEHPIDGGTFLRFEEVAAAVGMEAPPASEALLLDVEDDQDTDLLIASGAGNAWFENLRQMQFRRHELPAGTGLAAGDFDNDLREEVLIGGAVLKYRDGAFGNVAGAPALLDLDGDGILDRRPFEGLEPRGAVLSALGADLNRDGDGDLLLLTDKGLDLYLSLPARPTAWLDVAPRGLKTNKSGIGTVLRLYAGDLRVGTTCRDGLVSFGLGPRTLVDGVTLRWTNGVEQGVVGPSIDSCLAVQEREGEVGSCPFVYAFDGERWHFIADIQSGTPLGLPYADRQYLPARSDETVLIPGEFLRPRDGLLRIDLTEEFRELFYCDQVILRAVDHPASARPVLNEGFKVMKFPEFGVHALDDLRPPASARDHRGRDILELVSARDGRHAVVFDPLPMQYEGLAHPWSITLDFGDLRKAGRILFVMDGWVEFPTASASIAASRSKTVAFRPPVVEVVGPDGSWVMADADAGFPAGKGKNVLVDLTGKFATADGRVRVSSTQRLHWDAFSISTGPDREVRLTELALRAAGHKYRGMGVRVVDPAGEQPWRYDHDRLVENAPWDQLPAGMLTRYGEVKDLLAARDSRYPILASGDLVELAFEATALPPLPEGWVRDFAITTVGWVKDADMNQAIRESVEPLPFHGMSAYPYPAEERYPFPDFVQEWFTRPSRRLADPAKPWTAERVPSPQRNTSR